MNTKIIAAAAKLGHTATEADIAAIKQQYFRLISQGHITKAVRAYYFWTFNHNA
jgi:hypothetical protein